MVDAEEIKRLLEATPGVWQKSWRDTAVTQALQSAGRLALVALRSGKIIGFACLHDVGFRAYLSEMVVAESEQGKGTGSALLEVAERMLAAVGCHLIVADAYPPSEGFYRNQGWVTPNAVLMAKDIPREGGETNLKSSFTVIIS